MSVSFEPHWTQRPGTPIERVHRPRTLEAALRLLAERPELRVVAGGTDLVVELSREQGPAVELLDVTAIAGFDSIAGHDGPRPGHRLAGGVTHNDVVAHPGLVDGALALAQACLEIGSPQLRNRATIAGNLVTASPANDSISALMALDASVELAQWNGTAIETRVVPVADFFPGFRQTVRAPNELVSAVLVPSTGNARSLWVKLGLRKAQAISVVHAGLWVEFEGGDPGAPVRDLRLALGSVAPTVVLSEAARAAVVGRALTADVIAEAATAAAAGVEPIDDGRATADYRSASVATLVERALEAIAAGDHGARWPARIPTLRPVAGPHGATGQAADGAASAEVIDDVTEIAVELNGASLSAEGAASLTLLDWLREHAGTGTKEGCAEGECGACTVMLDGAAVMSCLTPAAQADGHVVTTVEGLGSSDGLGEMQQAFVDHFAVQCGFCIPGFIVSATALVDEVRDPTRDETEFGLAGNICRCTGYYSIIDAVRAAGGAS